MDSEPFIPVQDARPADRPWGPMTWPPPPQDVLRGTLVDLTPMTTDSEASGEVEDLYRALDDDAVWANLPSRPTSAADHARTLRQRREEGRVPWLVRLRRPLAGLPAGAVAGTSSYLNVSAHDARLEIGATCYATDLWGSGVNADAKLQLLAFAFGGLGAGRVQFVTDVRNHRSQRAIARLGANYEGTLRRYQRRADGTVRDSVLFSVAAEDWPRVRASLEGRVKKAADAANGTA